MDNNAVKDSGNRSPMENITKIYSNGFVANKDVNLQLRKGEIHGRGRERRRKNDSYEGTLRP